MKKIKKMFILLLLTYAVFTVVDQQKTLNKYNNEKVELSKQIEEEKQNQEQLAKRKDDVNSLEFIEQTAREKLDMYYPNERVYIDTGM